MIDLLLSIALAVPAEGPAFVAVGSGDDRTSGRLVRLSHDFTATIANRASQTTIADIVSLRRADRAVPPFPTGPHLVTTAGDRIAGTMIGGDGQSLRFIPGIGNVKPEKAWKIPLSMAVVAWLTDTPADTPPDSTRYSWLVGGKNQDVMRFRNGDTARGTLEALDPEAETLAFPFRPDRGAIRSIAPRELAAVAFNPALARQRKPKGPYARVVLSDGTRISLVNTSIDAGILTGESLFGQKVDLPLDSVEAFDVFLGKAVYLSDMKPIKVEQTGFLGVAWPWAADRTVRGLPLRIGTPHGEATADKGLGMRPRTMLTYNLNGKYRHFEALVGIDPGCAIRTKIAVRVYVDGKEVALPGVGALTEGKGVAVRVDLRGAKEIALLADFGPNGGVGAEVNWADARLIE